LGEKGLQFLKAPACVNVGTQANIYIYLLIWVQQCGNCEVSCLELPCLRRLQG